MTKKRKRVIAFKVYDCDRAEIKKFVRELLVKKGYVLYNV